MSVPVVLLAGGLGTRLREETEVKPEPKVEVGGRPIPWRTASGLTAPRELWDAHAAPWKPW